MKNQCFRFAGLNGAFAALLMLIISPFGLQAQPQSIPTKEGVECNALDSIDPAVFATMSEFWDRAWGRELTPGEEGMALIETVSPGVWEVLVTSQIENRYVDRGTFVEEASYEIDLGSALADQVYKDAVKATYVQHYVMAGTLVGSTGNSIPVTALVTDLGDRKGSIARFFSILKIRNDSADAATSAEGVANRLDVGRHSGDWTSEAAGFEKSGPSCQTACETQRNLRVASCNSSLAACNAIAIGAAAICGAACAGSGIAILICLGICQSARVAAMIVCMNIADSCIADADQNLDLCLAGCGPY